MSARNNTEKALITLRQRIVSGAISGGQRLFEVALAQELEMSRTPIRAALSKLAEEGLLDRAKAGGFAVRRFDLRDVSDTIELRGVLEGTLARLAAERGAPADALRKARDAARRIDAALAAENMDISIYSQHNTTFHSQLAHMADSAVLAREVARVNALPFASPSAFLDDEGRTQQARSALIIANAQHHAILDAIEARQGARAESVTREHARAALRNVEFLTTDAAALREGSPSLAIVSR